MLYNTFHINLYKYYFFHILLFSNQKKYLCILFLLTYSIHALTVHLYVILYLIKIHFTAICDNLPGAGLDGVCLITGDAVEGNPFGTAKNVGVIPCSCIPCAVTTLTKCCCCVNCN